MWANMLRAFQVGKAFTSDQSPSSRMRFSRGAWDQVSWPACHLTKASASANAEVLAEAGGRLADLGVSALDETVTLAVRAAAGSKRMTTRHPGPVSAERVTSTTGPRRIEVLGSDLGQRAPHSPSDHKTVNRSWPATES
jgi:hypothetical protein